MDKSESHLTQWQHNRNFITRIPPEYPDWIATVAFYAALQIIDALLAKQRISGVINHDTRNEVLRKTHNYSQIWKHYQPLFNLPRTVRYLADPTAWIPVTNLESQVFPRLYEIEKSVLGLMGRPDMKRDKLQILKSA